MEILFIGYYIISTIGTMLLLGGGMFGLIIATFAGWVLFPFLLIKQ